MWFFWGKWPFSIAFERYYSLAFVGRIGSTVWNVYVGGGGIKVWRDFAGHFQRWWSGGNGRDAEGLAARPSVVTSGRAVVGHKQIKSLASIAWRPMPPPPLSLLPAVRRVWRGLGGRARCVTRRHAAVGFEIFHLIPPPLTRAYVYIYMLHGCTE